MQTIELMQNNFKIPPLVYMVQNDTGRTLKMNIRDNTLEAGDTAKVAIIRSDGSYYTISATRVSGENAFSADMTQALTQPGQTECQLKVTSSSEVVSTYTFIIFVQESTDGVPEEQLGYSIKDLMDAAQTIISGGFTPELKAALLQLAEKVAYIDENGQDYYDALDAALNPPVDLVSISAVYTQSGTVYDTDALDSLKDDLVVTATYSDSSSEIVTAYTLSGTLTPGTSTITVSYGGKTATFTVTVTQYVVMTELYVGSSISKNQTTGTVTEATGGVDIASTGSASWNLFAYPSSDCPTFGDLNGHTIRLVWSIDSTSLASGNKCIIAFDACSNQSTYDRQKQCDLVETDYGNPDGSGTFEFVVNSSLWTAGSGTVTNASYLRYRCYLNGANGSSAQFRYKFYDLGVVS